VRFAVLGSGSRGNTAVVWSGGDAVLVDCGLPARRALADLDQLGLDPATIKGILLTHEHGDHVGGASVLARKLGVPVFCTEGTQVASKLGAKVRIERIVGGRSLRIGALDVEPFRIPHDAMEPVGFVVGVGAHRVGFATDMGSVRGSVVKALAGVRALLVEFNHDEHMLWHGEYPGFLKERVASDLGHLSNRQAADLLSRLAGGRLEHVFLGHVSLENNRLDLLLAAARAALEDHGRDVSVTVVTQDTPSAILRLHDGA
jgi:phosphoribosyl 1,2-cyclic phosphodiesterase